MINFASNLNKMIDAGLGGPLYPPRTEVAVGHRIIYTEVSGDVVNFETNVTAPLKNLRVTMEPVQDLHGYDKPWPVGGGKNMISFPYSTADGTYVGVTFATDSVGKITASGTTTSGMNFVLVRNGELPAGTYTLSIKGEHIGSSLLLRDLNASVMVAQIAPGSTDASTTFTVSEDISQYNLYFNTSAIGTEVNISAYVQLEPGSVATDYAPYSNICPIIGRDVVTVYRSGADMSNPQSATIQLGQTVYGGTVDVTTGTMTVTRGEIASYAGETLPGEWISDRDVYAAGTTPTIGAQVVYELADSFTIDLTPAQLSTLKGQNNVWSDAGDISLEYPYYEETEGY